MKDQTETLARAFAANIREACEDIDRENDNPVGSLLLEINNRNARPDYVGCCATHDFLDANMAMLAAFEEVAGRELATISETATDEEKGADSNLFNAAWTLARAACFWLDES